MTTARHLQLVDLPDPPATRLRREAVERTRLLAELAECRERRVAVLRAPAGYGKTILTEQLAARDPRPSCRVRLTRADDDPGALRGAVTDALSAAGLPRELARCGPVLLVLDDVDLLHGPATRAALSALLDDAPEGAQIVLAGRSEPELPLARLRAAGDVVDVRAPELAFDMRETTQLLEICGGAPDAETAEALWLRAEGWAAGIALAARSDRGAPAGIDGPDVTGYLREEVLDSLTPELRSFLLGTSLLSGLRADLCDAALAIEGSGPLLAELERRSLFVAPERGDREWLRCHPVLRSVLQAALRSEEPERIPGILSGAAAWHEVHGDPGEAFAHARACGDLARAGGILLRHADTLVARGEVATLKGWLGRCTPEELASDAQLALGGAWVALLVGDSHEALRLTAAAETVTENMAGDAAVTLRSAVANLRSALAPGGVGQMLRDGRFVCANEAPGATHPVLHGWRAIGTARLLDGHPDEAIAAFSEILLLAHGHPEFDVLVICCLGYAALAAAEEGDWRRARRWARDGHALATERGLCGVIQSAPALTAHAVVLQHDGLLRKAADALAGARAIAPLLHAVRWLDADMNLRWADVSLGLGDQATALDCADAARDALAHYPDPAGMAERLATIETRLRSGRALELTPSELRLVPFLPSHLTLQEIGDRVYLSRATVKTHTVSIYRKLGASSRSEAVDRLEATGLLQQPLAAVRSV